MQSLAHIFDLDLRALITAAWDVQERRRRGA
jgi:hypothetical protein